MPQLSTNNVYSCLPSRTYASRTHVAPTGLLSCLAGDIYEKLAFWKCHVITPLIIMQSKCLLVLLFWRTDSMCSRHIIAIEQPVYSLLKNNHCLNQANKTTHFSHAWFDSLGLHAWRDPIFQNTVYSRKKFIASLALHIMLSWLYHQYNFFRTPCIQFVEEKSLFESRYILIK